MNILRFFFLAALFILCTSYCPTASAADSAGLQDQLSGALAVLDEANTLAEENENDAIPTYRRAAAALDNIRVTNDLHNAELEHAIGNAYLKGGEHGHAILAYRRALLLDPTNRSIAETLKGARAAVGSQAPPSNTNRVLGWLLAWRGTIPRSAAWLGATAAFLLGWVCFAIRVGLGVRPLVPAGVACLTGSILVFAVLGLDHWESRSRATGVLLESGVLARTGPSARVFDPAFQDPLPEGSEFVVVDARDGWSKIQLASNALGWVPTDTIGMVNPTRSQ